MRVFGSATQPSEDRHEHEKVVRVTVEVGVPMLMHLDGVGDRASVLVPGQQGDLRAGGAAKGVRGGEAGQR